MPAWAWVLAGGASAFFLTLRLWIRARVIRHVVDTGREDVTEIIEATGRALSPASEAVRERRHRQKKRPSNPRPKAVEAAPDLPRPRTDDPAAS